MQSEKNINKTIIKYYQNNLMTISFFSLSLYIFLSLIQTVLKNKSTYRFNYNASYLIADGFDDFKRNITR